MCEMKLAEEILLRGLSDLVCVFIFVFCYCFLSVYSKIPEERNDFDQKCSSKKKLGESLQTLQEGPLGV